MAYPSESIYMVAAGCTADCQGLVQKFTTATPPDYSYRAFAEKWKSMNFELILCCRPQVETNLLAQELLTIVKNLLVGEGTTCENRVGYMYLLYSLYYKQNSRRKIRLTMNEYCCVFKNVLEFKERGFKEAEFAFFKLFFDKAFYFCATQFEFTYLYAQKSLLLEDEADSRDFVPDIHSLLGECDGLSNQGLAELDLINSKYEELKRNFPTVVGTHNPTVGEEFISSLKNEIDAVHYNYEKYKKARPLSRTSSPGSLVEEDHGAQRRKLRKNALAAQSDSDYKPPNSARGRSTPRRNK